MILVLAANPSDTPRLRLDTEVREISNGLQRARKRDEFVLRHVWAPRSIDVRRAMLDEKPKIVHFCGHGDGSAGLAFEDSLGGSQLVASQTLGEFFSLFADVVDCIVLNACYSETQAEAIATHIRYVIGMSKAISDHAAIEFSVAFYDALGAGETIEFAYQLACNAIKWAGLPESLIPVLKVRKPHEISPRGRTLLAGESRYNDASTSTELRPVLVDSAAMCFVDIMRLACVAASPAARTQNHSRYPEFVDIADQHFGELRTQATRIATDSDPLVMVKLNEVERGIAWAIGRLRRAPQLDRSWIQFARPLQQISERVNGFAEATSPDYYRLRFSELSPIVTRALATATGQGLGDPDEFIRIRLTGQSVVMVQTASSHKLVTATIRDDMDQKLALPYFLIDLTLLRKLTPDEGDQPPCT